MTDTTMCIDPAPVPPISEEQARHAARVIAGNARDAHDAEEAARASAASFGWHVGRNGTALCDDCDGENE